MAYINKPAKPVEIPDPETDLGNVLFVSANGDNSTAEPGNVHKPWAHPYAAMRYANQNIYPSKATVFCFAGEYSVNPAPANGDEGMNNGVLILDNATIVGAPNLYRGFELRYPGTGWQVETGMDFEIRGGYLKEIWIAFGRNVNAKLTVNVDRWDGAIRTLELDSVNNCDVSISAKKVVIGPSGEGAFCYFTDFRSPALGASLLNSTVSIIVDTITVQRANVSSGYQGLISNRPASGNAPINASEVFIKFNNFEASGFDAPTSRGVIMGFSNNQLINTKFTLEIENLRQANVNNVTTSVGSAYDTQCIRWQFGVDSSSQLNIKVSGQSDTAFYSGTSTGNGTVRVTGNIKTNVLPAIFTASGNNVRTIFSGFFHTLQREAGFIGGGALLQSSVLETSLAGAPAVQLSASGSRYFDVQLQNDGAVPAINAAAPRTINVAGAFQTPGSALSANVTTNRLTEYGGGSAGLTSANEGLSVSGTTAQLGNATPMTKNAEIVGQAGFDAGILLFDTVSMVANDEIFLDAPNGVSVNQGLIKLGGNSVILAGTGSPEGVITANVGSMFLRSDGGAGTTLYVKETGSGNTGWAAK